jgi:hypothetical protein
LKIIFVFLCLVAARPVAAQKPDDPFAGVESATPKSAENNSGFKRFFRDNVGFRKELMFQTDTNDDGEFASRQSAGFEVLKKFSTATSTVASFDFQGRFVRRDGFSPVMNDMEGATRRGWEFEYHNLYADFYNVFNPVMGDAAKSENVGRFNFRIGHFYVPFGLNLQTDTHGTVLQLSNESNFGFERDWYAGFWGRLNKHLNYEAHYMVGSGYDLKVKGQSGLGAVRVSLSNQYSSKYGVEGGVSVIAGERLAMNDMPLATRRIGIDGRYRHAAANGLVTIATELSGGRDASSNVFTQLYQAEYLRGSRRWSVAGQYRRRETDASLIGDVAWYFRNDVSGSNLHSIRLNVERKLHNASLPPHTVVTLEYYLYR